MSSPINSALQYKTQLATAGFEEIKEEVFKWPSNKWPRNPHYKKLGMHRAGSISYR
jgi:hypothetical protein